MFIETRLPKATRISLTLLRDQYGFTTEQLNEIKQNWIVDHRDSNIYCKPNSTFHKELNYIKYEQQQKDNHRATGQSTESDT
jgi:hypothetical protein